MGTTIAVRNADHKPKARVEQQTQEPMVDVDGVVEERKGQQALPYRFLNLHKS